MNWQLASIAEVQLCGAFSRRLSHNLIVVDDRNCHRRAHPRCQLVQYGKPNFCSGANRNFRRGCKTTEPCRRTRVYSTARRWRSLHSSSSRRAWGIRAPRGPRPVDGESRASHRRPGLPSRPAKRVSAANALRWPIFCPRIGADVAAGQMVGFADQPGRGASALW